MQLELCTQKVRSYAVRKAGLMSLKIPTEGEAYDAERHLLLGTQPSTAFLPLNSPLMQDILSVHSALRLICDYIRNVRRPESRYGTTNSTVKGERLLRLVRWNYHIYGMTRSSNIGILSPMMGPPVSYLESTVPTPTYYIKYYVTIVPTFRLPHCCFGGHWGGSQVEFIATWSVSQRHQKFR